MLITDRFGRALASLPLALLFACGESGDAPETSSRTSTPKQPPAEAKEDPAPAKTDRPTSDPNATAPPVRKDGTVYGQSELMGTRVSVNLFVGDPNRATEAGHAIQAALDEMSRIEHIMSEWKPQSELSNFSRAAGGPPQAVSPELFEVLSRSREIRTAPGLAPTEGTPGISAMASPTRPW